MQCMPPKVIGSVSPSQCVIFADVRSPVRFCVSDDLQRDARNRALDEVIAYYIQVKKSIKGQGAPTIYNTLIGIISASKTTAELTRNSKIPLSITHHTYFYHYILIQQ